MQALPATFLARVGQLDRLSAVPLCCQLEERLKQNIEAGNWAAGDLLPSEGQLGVSRTVIRKAPDILQADGQVLRQKGRGTVALCPKQWLQARTTSRAWNAEDFDTGAIIARLIDARVTTAGHNLVRMLSVPVRSEVFELTTATSVANQPVGLMQASCQPTPAHRFLAFTMQVGCPSSRSVVKSCSHSCRCSRHCRFTAPKSLSKQPPRMNANAEYSPSGGSGTLLITTLEKDVQDVPVAFTRAVYLSAHFCFAASVVR